MLPLGHSVVFPDYCEVIHHMARCLGYQPGNATHEVGHATTDQSRLMPPGAPSINKGDKTQRAKRMRARMGKPSLSICVSGQVRLAQVYSRWRVGKVSATISGLIGGY